MSHEFPHIQVIKDGISVTDIYQGNIGDCYLLSAISAIAEFPDRINRILLQRKRSPKGAYCVALCIAGQFKEIYLDDIILCQNYAKQDDDGRFGLAFAQNKEGEMWTIMIEKAYAKAYGGYHNIGNGGCGDSAFFDLTGAPSESISFTHISILSGKQRRAKKRIKPEDELEPEDLSEKEINFLFEKIYDYDQLGFILACGTRDFNGQEEAKYLKLKGERDRIKAENYKKSASKRVQLQTVEREFGNGLYTTHAYTLVDAIKLSNGVKLFKLRNPWGKGEFTGEYCDESPLWTPKLKEEAGYSAVIDDGIFFLKVEDFVMYFDEIYACHYREKYIISSMSDINGTNFACYEFNIASPGETYFGVSQPDRNGLPEKHTYGYLSIVVVKIKRNNTVSFIGGKGRAYRDVWFKARCEPGKYIAIVSTLWKEDNVNFVKQGSDDSNLISFWVYAKNATKIRRIRKEKNLKSCEKYLYDGLKDYARKEAEKTGPDGWFGRDRHIYKFFNLTSFGYLITYVRLLDTCSSKGAYQFINMRMTNTVPIIYPLNIEKYQIKKDDAPWFLQNNKKLRKDEVDYYLKFEILKGNDLIIVGQVQGGRITSSYNMVRKWM